MARIVEVPEHRHNDVICTGTNIIKVTNGKYRFKCPVCGKMFSIENNLYKTDDEPEAIKNGDEYICTISGETLHVSNKGEVECLNIHCNLCKDGPGFIFGYEIDGGFRPGFYADTTSGLTVHHRLHMPPANVLADLGLYGLEVHESMVLDGISYYHLTFDYKDEVRVPKYMGSGLYDIDDDEYVLFHKYIHIVTYDEDNNCWEKSKERKHIAALMDVKTRQMILMPNVNKSYFDFAFKPGVMYSYIPQKGHDLVDANVFTDNTKYMGYKTKECLYNPQTRKIETIYGYLIEKSEENDLLKMMGRSTRVFSNDDWSGVPKHQKHLLWQLKNARSKASVLNAMRDGDYYNKFIDDFLPHYNGNLELENISPEDFLDFEADKETLDIYKDIAEFVEEYCLQYSGRLEDVLRNIHLDNLEDDNESFERWSYENSNRKYPEGEFSNKDLIEACKGERDNKLVVVSSYTNLINLAKYYNLAPKTMGRFLVNEVACNYAPSNKGNFSAIIDNSNDLYKTMNLYGEKPKEEWSDMDHERFARGTDVKEIIRTIIGMLVHQDDPITRHCLYNEALPEDWVVISVTGSRALPLFLRTVEENGRYTTPAVQVWKGYYMTHKVKVLHARIAKGSDMAAIVAALELNEELAATLSQMVEDGELSQEEADKRYEDERVIIVALLHGWWKSADYNNEALTALLEKVVQTGGYVLCNEPFRHKRPTEYDWFDRRIGRTNKLLVKLSPTLVSLCRAVYSGTSNTIKMAQKMGKNIVELSSPAREVTKKPPVIYKSSITRMVLNSPNIYTGVINITKVSDGIYKGYEAFRNNPANEIVIEGLSDSEIFKHIRDIRSENDPIRPRTSPYISNGAIEVVDVEEDVEDKPTSSTTKPLRGLYDYEYVDLFRDYLPYGVTMRVKRVYHQVILMCPPCHHDYTKWSFKKNKEFDLEVERRLVLVNKNPLPSSKKASIDTSSQKKKISIEEALEKSSIAKEMDAKWDELDSNKWNKDKETKRLF